MPPVHSPRGAALTRRSSSAAESGRSLARFTHMHCSHEPESPGKSAYHYGTLIRTPTLFTLWLIGLCSKSSQR
jgi:hypothetical protein